MAEKRSLSTAAKTHGSASIFAAVGVALQAIVGVPGYPAVPPGPIILAICGILVLTLMTRFKWIIIIGLIGPLFVGVGGAIEGSSWGRLADPGNFAFFITTAIQWIGLVVSIVFGIMALVQAFRKEPAAAA